MHTHNLLPLLLALPACHAAETILGLYIFHRHGDRTAKATPPTKLTDLGYREVFTSGTWFRDQYVSSSATTPVSGLSPNLVTLSQIVASAPYDTVLMPSTQGFLQGLYPPVGSTLGSDPLRNGTIVEVPLNGYQIIPVQTVASGTGSEDQAWLQGAENCANAMISSNNYLSSPQYLSLLNSTRDFYTSLTPTINATLSPSDISYQKAYTIFDLLNVAEIHNATIPNSSILTNDTLLQVRTLADTHEWNLAYNASDPIRAIAGATLAAQIVEALNATVASSGKVSPVNIQFGAYDSFQSFFGLANLTAANPDFYGIPDYASSMTFELFTTVTPSPFPSPSDLSVRFLFHNGTTSNTSTPVPYPLFGSSSPEMSWNDFMSGMNKFKVGSQAQWCAACGNTTGVCAAQGSNTPSGPAPATASGSAGGSGVSRPVAGVIGAMVTLAVILGVEGLIMLLAGLRLVRKTRLGGAGDGTVAEK